MSLAGCQVVHHADTLVSIWEVSFTAVRTSSTKFSVELENALYEVITSLGDI